ncbi:twin-arginine translocation pathway signal protein [Variovorax saccharolyticus]|uniref:twin-arginine translocation pathway signal protein n=1 Tax=Variovorax saccharolyticus TaxID=3053516 RepID=UPI0025777263|nr:twin-arginine translocation pathway signal protein [Variovorax sp. J22R187]MDM0021028.1 twin-arginine translocation pathway signal protein [Variovorax sp. J22R187]
MDELRVFTRRRMLGATGIGALSALVGQPVVSSAQTRAVQPGATRLTQLLDMSPDQQELSRDYATGVRLAFAELRKTNSALPQLATIETDGTAASVRAAIQAVKSDPGQVALLGAAGEALALATVREAAQAQLEIAHVAPWLADPRYDQDRHLVALFASREEQMRQVLKGLATMGVSELGVVYPSPQHAEALQAGTAALTSRLQVRLRSLTVPAGQDIALFASRLKPDDPYFLVFMGGSIELAQFTRGLSQRGQQRYVICLADVDTTTFMQLGPGKKVPIVFTQVVPNPHSSKVPLVRAYRDALARLFDEAPSPISLAGYIAGRYAAAVLAGVEPNAGRARVLAEFQRRRPVQLDGWRVEFEDGGRGGSYVSQLLLNAQGVFIG